MRNERGQIDWNRAREEAQAKTTARLHQLLRDIRASLEAADACDRTHGTDEGGLLRDEASVIRCVLEDRKALLLSGRLIAVIRELADIQASEPRDLHEETDLGHAHRSVRLAIGDLRSALVAAEREESKEVEAYWASERDWDEGLAEAEGAWLRHAEREDPEAQRDL